MNKERKTLNFFELSRGKRTKMEGVENDKSLGRMKRDEWMEG